MKLPWVTQVGSKFSDKCLYKSEADRDYTHRGKDQVKIRQRLELDSCESRKMPGPAEAGRSQKESSSQSLKTEHSPDENLTLNF